ncbi:MAG: prolipoprotein diacylglyceryl transferase [Flavobacteriaceae bacterium]
MIFLKSTWAPDETLFEFFGFGIHMYSLMFVIAFGLGYRLMKTMFKNEKVSFEYLEPMLVYMVFSTLIGARLGHVLFYDWAYYSAHVIEIFLPIKETAEGYRFIGFRGLASHGAVLGILTGLYLFQKKYPFRSLLWILDRLTIPVSIGGMFVRIGNFYNSEIVGKYTGNDFGVVFENRGEILPRHPAQLYEALGYLLLFFVLRKLYTHHSTKAGWLLGVFFSGLFTIRFIVEFVKESQGGFEEFMPMFSTGQWLSIPLIIGGLILTLYAQRKAQ